MVCGVPGSGKTWVCNQLKHKYEYIAHDETETLVSDVLKAARKNPQKKILIDCPFGERLLLESLLKNGLNVRPVFIIEDPKVVYQRYSQREKKPPSQNILTRAESILNRANEWNAERGNSSQILEYLRDLK